MNKTIQNILAISAGFIAGMALNGWLISVSPSIIDLPEGVDPNKLESIKAHIHLYKWQHFIMPFVAHAFGTLIAAYIAAKIWIGNKMITGYIFGSFFLVGGVTMVYLIGNPPVIPTVLDLIFAYFPMGWIGAKLGGAK
jgi:hypothetical protein